MKQLDCLLLSLQSNLCLELVFQFLLSTFPDILFSGSLLDIASKLNVLWVSLEVSIFDFYTLALWKSGLVFWLALLDEKSLVDFVGNWFLVSYIHKLGQCSQGIWSICDFFCELFLESSLWWFHSELFNLCTWLGLLILSWILRLQLFSVLLATLVFIPQSNSLKIVLVIDSFSMISFSHSCVLASDFFNHSSTYFLCVPV